MKQGRAISIGIALCLAAIVVVPITAQAEVVFTPPQTLAPVEAGTPQVAVDPQGTVTVLWQELAPDHESRLIRTRQIDPSGVPGPVHTIGEVPILNGAPQCMCPELTVDRFGRATAVWQTVTPLGRRVAAARIDPSGIPQPTRLLSPPGVQGWYGKVAVGPDGQVGVVWEVGTPQQVQAVLLAPDGTRGEVQSLSEEGDGGLPAITAGPDGRFYVSWSVNEGVEVTKLDEDGAAEEAKFVSPLGEDAGATDIVVDSKGRATVSWWRGAGVYEAKAVRLEADGTPGPVRTLSPPDQNAFDPRLAVDPQDRVTAVWQDFEERVFSVRLGADGVPGELQQLSPQGQPAGEPEVAAAADGRVVVTWTYPPPVFAPEPECLESDIDPAFDVVQAAFIGADGDLDRIHDVSAHGEESFSAELALDPSGLPWVVWWSFDGTYFCKDWDSRVQASHAIAAQSPGEEEPAPTPPAPPAPPVPPAPPATLQVARKGVADGGRLTIRARCHAGPGATCSGPIRLVVPASALRRGLESDLRKRLPATLPIARGSYRVQAGQAKVLTLRIPKAAQPFLAAAEPGWLAAKARGRGLVASNVLVRLAGPKP